MKQQATSRDRSARHVARIAGLGSVLAWLACLLLIPSAGCGKGEYEQRMDKRMSQLQRSGGSAPADSPDDAELEPEDEDF